MNVNRESTDEEFYQAEEYLENSSGSTKTVFMTRQQYDTFLKKKSTSLVEIQVTNGHYLDIEGEACIIL